jgi:ribulose 1,5-bisphosphate synthetase/thiazole synthase
MNKQIELVKKWLADNSSVSVEELSEASASADEALDDIDYKYGCNEVAFEELQAAKAISIAASAACNAADYALQSVLFHDYAVEAKRSVAYWVMCYHKQELKLLT